jgi:hypothetical protein
VRIAHPIPAFARLGWQQSISPKGRRSVGNAFEHGYAIAETPSQLATMGFDNRVHALNSFGGQSLISRLACLGRHTFLQVARASGHKMTQAV